MKNIAKIIFVGSFICGAAMAGEGSIEITGTGEATSTPQFAEVRVNVISICYEKSLDAKDTNAILANKLIDVLKQFAREERDRVYATGGQNTRQTEIFYLPQGGSKILCERKWRATNTVTLQTAAIGDLPKIQDRLLSAIDDQEGVDQSKRAQTYGELMQPNFFAYPETMKGLIKQSQRRAWDDAQEQLSVFKEKCNFKKVQLKTISEPSHSVYPRLIDRVLSKDSTETPILPENLFVRAVWRFFWTFEQSSICLQ